jgi:CRP-like cAMP-binding protein
MTEATQLAPHHIGCGIPSKVLTPLSAPLFAVAARRQLEAEEALFVVGEPGDGWYRLEKGLLKVVITSLLGKDRILVKN